MATGSSDGPSEVARIFLVTNIPPAYGTERGLRNCFRQYSGQEGPQVEYFNVRSPDSNTEAALVTVEGLGSDGAHDVLQQKMLLGGRTLNISHVCSELVTLQFGDVDGHLSQIMQKIAGRMGLLVTVRRKEVCVSGPFDLVQQFRMDLRAEVFLNAQCSSYTSVTTASSQPAQYTQPPPKKGPHVLFDAGSSSSKVSNEMLSEQHTKVDADQNLFINQKTLESDTQMVIDNLSPDVLHLLDKIPEGDISGVQYNPSLGTVTIQGLNKAEVKEATTKFEAVYESILNQFQLDIVQLDKETDINALLPLMNDLSHQYVRCAFVHSEDTQMVKILSNSAEQMEQAKRQLLQHLNLTPTEVDGAGGVATGEDEGKAEEGRTASKKGISDFTTKLKSGHTITIKKGDISKESASVLVATINDRFECVGDMSAAINAASRGNIQQKLQEYAKANSLVNAGDLIVTKGGGALKCKHVYNVVCPDLTDSVGVAEPRVTLTSQVTKVLLEAEKHKVPSVVMPSFLSAIFVDVEMVAKAVTEAIVDYCYSCQSGSKNPVVSNIMVVVGDEATYGCFVRNLSQSRSGHRSDEGSKGTEGRPTEVRTSEDGTGYHTDVPIMAHGHPHPTSAEYLPKVDAVPNKPSSPVPTSSSNNKPTANPPASSNPSATSSPTISPRMTSKRDHPLYQAPDVTKAVSKSDASPAMMDENCPVCGGPFNTPMTSKCEHAFCNLCMDQATKNGAPLCPVCKVTMQGMMPPICPLCKEQVHEAVTTVCCHQIFCRECLTKHLKLFSQCPNCKHTFSNGKKAQPQSSGDMSITCVSSALPGYAGSDTIQITYDVPNGIDANGQPYLGANRVAYLPDNIEGREILKLLQKAWQEGLIYTIGPKSEVVWTDIPHKTNTTGGQLNRGYPDRQYFYNVKQSLASKGIVP